MPSGHKAAYENWFRRYDKERKKRHISAGRPVPGVPPAPPGPDEIRLLIFDGINPLSERIAAELCGVHRTTVGRWLDGSVQIPAAAYSLLRFAANGVPPGCGDAWLGFQWSGDGLVCPDGKTAVQAQEIAGIVHLRRYISALETRCGELEASLCDLVRQIDHGSANDPYTDPADPRSRAFTAGR